MRVLVALVGWLGLGVRGGEVEDAVRPILDSCPPGFETAPVAVCDPHSVAVPKPRLFHHWTATLKRLRHRANCSIQILFVLQDYKQTEDTEVIRLVTQEVFRLDNDSPCRQVFGVLLSRERGTGLNFAYAKNVRGASEDCQAVPKSLKSVLNGRKGFTLRINQTLDWLKKAVLEPVSCEAVQSPQLGSENYPMPFHNFNQHTKELIAGAILTALGICGACMCVVCALLLSRGTDLFSRRREAWAAKQALKHSRTPSSPDQIPLEETESAARILVVDAGGGPEVKSLSPARTPSGDVEAQSLISPS